MKSKAWARAIAVESLLTEISGRIKTGESSVDPVTLLDGERDTADRSDALLTLIATKRVVVTGDGRLTVKASQSACAARR